MQTRIAYLLLLLTMLSWTQGAEKLAKVIHVASVGSSFPTSIKGNWFPAQGRLTHVGMRQLYLLGRQLRQRYIEETSLLHDQFNPQQLVFRTSYSDRTAASMSAYAFAAGLYMAGSGYSLSDIQIPKAVPPVNFTDYSRYQKELNDAALLHYYTTLPIRSLTNGSNYGLEAALLCPNVKNLVAEAKNANGTRKQIIEEREKNYQQKLYPKLRQMCEIDIESSDKALDCRDYIMAAKHFAQELNASLTDEEKKLLDELYETKKYLEFFGGLHVAQLVSYTLLSEALDFLNSTLPLEGDQLQVYPHSTAMLSYTLDDWNLLALLRLFEYQPKLQSLVVPYASSLHIEVWEVGPNNTPADYKVNISYNGVPVLWNASVDSISLPEFRKWIKSNLISNFLESCLGSVPIEDMTTWNIVSLILGAVILIILGVTCFFLMRKSSSENEPEPAAATDNPTNP